MQQQAHPRRRARNRLGLLALAALVSAGYAVWRGGRNAPGGAAPPAQRSVMAFEAAETILDAKLGRGWTIEGLGPREVTSTGPIRVDLSSFGSISFKHDALSPNYGALIFRFKAPVTFGDFLQVSLHSSQSESFPRLSVAQSDIAPLADGWSEVLLALTTLDPAGLPFDSIVLQAGRTVGSGWVELDKVTLTKPTSALPSIADLPLVQVKLRIDCSAPIKPISPLVYGIARGVISSGETAHRIGGNAMTRLNWDLGNVWNTGGDWFFENVKGPDAGLVSWLADAQQAGLQMALTVPTLGWVAKDTTSVGFPVSVFGAQRKHDPQRADAGDGYSAAGEPLAPHAPTLTSEAAPPERIKQWVQRLVERDKQSGKRSVQLYLLDNEPDLWHQTHRDVHPEPLSYDELLDRTLRYARAIREADPEAVIAGPASWGWSGYFYSAKDQVAGFAQKPDRRAHDGLPLLAWYLKKLAEEEHRSGLKLLDVLDVHYYPQAEGVYGDHAGTDSTTAALRLRSTRSLWDPSYRDESWIKDTVRLLPRLHEWVDQNYPGRGISLGEWSFGAEGHISGGLATAEALGRFGQNGVTAAFYWAAPAVGTPTYWAFRAFRNYDGRGAAFLERSVPTHTEGDVSMFASTNGSSDRLVVVLLNLGASAVVEPTIDTSTCGQLSLGRTFSYLGQATGITEEPAAKGAGAAQRLRLPPSSLRIVEFSKAP